MLRSFAGCYSNPGHNCTDHQAHQIVWEQNLDITQEAGGFQRQIDIGGDGGYRETKAMWRSGRLCEVGKRGNGEIMQGTNCAPRSQFHWTMPMPFWLSVANVMIEVTALAEGCCSVPGTSAEKAGGHATRSTAGMKKGEVTGELIQE